MNPLLSRNKKFLSLLALEALEWSYPSTCITCIIFFSLFLFYNSLLPNDKILGQSKLKAFADDKINVAENFEFAFERVEILW